MGTEKNKNTKWIVISCIIFVLAILVAVGPILVTKYMRAKWQEAPKYKTSHLLMEVAGTLQQSQDNGLYLKGDNENYYMLENVKDEVYDRVGQHCSVFGKMRFPKNNETVDGNVIRLFLIVNKITFDDATEISSVNDDNIKPGATEEEIKRKTLARTQLRLEVNTRLNKPILFDVIKGKVSVQNRKTLSGEDVVVSILTDEFGDNYMLYKKGVSFESLKDKEVICLGRDMLPLKTMPIVMDEITFEIYEIYNLEYNKTM